jgi:hypothetical protein
MAEWEEVRPTRTRDELANIFGVTPKQFDKTMKKIKKEIRKQK